MPGILHRREDAPRLRPFPARIWIECLDPFGNRPSVLAKVLFEHLVIVTDHECLDPCRAVAGRAREDSKAADHPAVNNT